MDLRARDQYLKALRERYFQTSSKKERGKMLDEYCRNTGQNRKHVIWKIRHGMLSYPKS